jgi:hypothetical protein
MRVVIIALLLSASSRRDEEERIFERRETGADGHVGARVTFLTTLVCVMKGGSLCFRGGCSRALKTTALAYFQVVIIVILQLHSLRIIMCFFDNDSL